MHLNNKLKLPLFLLIIYITVSLLLRPGYYFSNCSCSWLFSLIGPGVDCQVICIHEETKPLMADFINLLFLHSVRDTFSELKQWFREKTYRFPCPQETVIDCGKRDPTIKELKYCYEENRRLIEKHCPKIRFE